MANHKSAEKRIRRNNKRQDINTARKSRIRTFLKKVEMAIAGGDAKVANEALREAQPELARGAARNVFSKGAISRKMSRLSARIKALKK